jgi:sugar/nucleoside kinase (ribokinase family)
MSAPAAPDLLIVGQVTIDDVVPATPGPWQRQIGGSSLYAVAGARHWIEPERIGLVACVGQDYPFDVEALLGGIGVRCALTQFDAPHLIEWLIYEPDGSRRSLPRNPELLAIGAEGSWSQPAPAAVDAALQARMLQMAPGLRQIPETWCSAGAVHLCPQVGNRHTETVRGLAGRVRWISVDPSPHYARPADAAALAHKLPGVNALLPSAQDLAALLRQLAPSAAARALSQAGFPEVVLRRGGESILLAHAGQLHELPVKRVAPLDPTGAGDAFCGAYAACRLSGVQPLDAARRAAATAALVVTCRGVEAALALERPRI